MPELTPEQIQSFENEKQKTKTKPKGFQVGVNQSRPQSQQDFQESDDSDPTSIAPFNPQAELNAIAQSAVPYVQEVEDIGQGISNQIDAALHRIVVGVADHIETAPERGIAMLGQELASRPKPQRSSLHLFSLGDFYQAPQISGNTKSAKLFLNPAK